MINSCYLMTINDNHQTYMHINEHPLTSFIMLKHTRGYIKIDKTHLKLMEINESQRSFINSNDASITIIANQ